MNGEYYRRQMSADDRRVYQKEYHRKWRAARKTSQQVKAESDGRARRFVEALDRGDENGADAIAAENLPGALD